MSDVSRRLLTAFLRRLADLGIDVPALVGDLPLPWEESSPDNRHIDWHDLVELLVRLERRVGGSHGLEELGELVADVQRTALHPFLGAFCSPAALYRLVHGRMLPRALPFIESRLEALADNRLCIETRIPDRVRACPQIFHLMTGAGRALPRSISRRDAVVVAVVEERAARHTITLPPSSSVVARTRRLFHSVFGPRASVSTLEAERLELEAQFDELQRAHAELRERAARQRSILEAAGDTLLELSTEGRVLYASPAVRALIGYGPDQVAGSALSLWLPRAEAGRGEREIPLLRTPRENSDRVDRGLIDLHHASGDTITAEYSSRAYQASPGEWRIVAVLRRSGQWNTQAHPVTSGRGASARSRRARRQPGDPRRELRELQALLLHSERLEGARDSAAHIAHAIRNPLAALIHRLEIAQRSPADSLPPEDLIGLARRIEAVVRRSLDLYREGKANRAPVSLEAVLTDVAESLESTVQTSGVQLQVQLRAAADSVLDADRELLGAALVALVENGLDASPAGSTVRLIAEPGEGQWLFRVVDEGPGLPADLRALALEPYFTTREDGTGLGLPIARSVALAHGGGLDFAPPRPGAQGTEVRLAIPATTPPTASPSGPAVHSAAARA